MASPEVLDIASLLQPIPGDNPAGMDIRLDATPSSPYYQLKDARNAARAAERRVPEPGKERETAPPDWRPVLRNAQSALANLTKNLEVSAFLIEALVRLHGFAGLRDGFKLTRGLVEQFWDELYPLPDEEGVDTRVAPLAGLNGVDAEGTLIAPIALVPIAEDSGEGAYGWYHYDQALEFEKLIAEEREKRQTDKTLTLAKIQRAVDETGKKNERPVRFYVDLVDDVKQCQAEYDGLCQALKERCGDRSPPESNIRNALANCFDAILVLARDKLPSPAEAELIAVSAGDGHSPTGTAMALGAIGQRDEALQMLQRVADFFRRTEPHNPVSYALEQAVRWSRLMAVFIPNGPGCPPRSPSARSYGVALPGTTGHQFR
jgi:type VI secretion system protein ImpA